MIQNSADRLPINTAKILLVITSYTSNLERPQSWIDDFNNQLENDKNTKNSKMGLEIRKTMAQEEMAAAQSEKDAEMKEVYDYLEYMTARDQAYLASLEPTAEAQPEAEAEAQPEAEDMPDNA